MAFVVGVGDAAAIWVGEALFVAVSVVAVADGLGESCGALAVGGALAGGAP